MKIYKKDLPYILLLLSLVIIFFNKVIFSGNRLLLGSPFCDIYRLFFDRRYYGFKTLAEGIIPLWNPYNFGGTPFVAGIESAIFYPLNFIFLIFPTSLAINYSIILHVFLSGLFFYYFIRYWGVERFSALISAVVFMFSASQICRVYAGHLSNICTMVWLPLELLFLEKCIRKKSIRYALLTGIVFALQILAGHFQYFCYSLMAVFIYFIFRLAVLFRGNKDLKKVARLSVLFILLIVVGFSLAAIQLFPSFEFVEDSLRRDLSYQFCSQGPFPPENLVTFLIPDFFGDTFKNYWGRWYLWENCPYIGILPLILGVIALSFRRNKYTLFFSGLALFSLVLAFGKYTPLFKVLYNFIPGFNVFRGHSKFLFLTTFALATLTGFGSNFLFRPLKDQERRGLLRLSWVLIVLTILLLTAAIVALIAKDNLIFWKRFLEQNLLLGDRYYPLIILKDPDILRNTFLTSFKGMIKFAAFLITSAVLILLWTKKRIKSGIFKTLVLILVVVDLGIFGAKWVVPFDARQRDWREDVVGFLKKDQEPYRVITPDSPWLNRGMVYRIANIGGYDANFIRQYQEFINFSQDYPLNHPTLVMRLEKYSPLLNLLNLKYVILYSEILAKAPGFDLVFSNERVNIYQNRDYLPRTFIVHRVRVLKEKIAILKELKSKNFNPRECVILEEELPAKMMDKLPLSLTEALPRITEYSANKVVIETELLQDGFLVLADTYYPGWKAFVDGEETKIYRANYILRAVYLTAGEHTVNFIYDPFSFRLGLYLTLATIIILSGSGIGRILLRRSKGK